MRISPLLFASAAFASAASLFAEPPPGKQLAEPFPARVHVFEDYETEIEKRWWLRGTQEEKDVAESLSSIPNIRACRASVTKDFDKKMGDPSRDYKAVIFNPVPGPPMGSATRLSFRYKLEGTDSIRVQIYSLSKNFHRQLTLTDLPIGEWRSTTVDMTKLRRPDGSGGPLAEDERIDDIQFYIDPAAELLVDDIVLFDAAPAGETRPFPRRILFSGWFDTGKQGDEWPGDFEIVPHEKPLTWDAAKAVSRPGGKPAKWLRIDLRGDRPLGLETALRFRYRLSKAGEITVVLARRDGGDRRKVAELERATLEKATVGRWEVADFEFPHADRSRLATEIQILAPEGADLLVDDLLLFEP